MAQTFPQNIADIRSAVWGYQVREAIAEAMEQTYSQYQNVEDFVEQMSVLKYVDVSIRDTYGYLWGDVNGDGVVNNSDLIIVQNYVNGISVNPRGDGTTQWKSCVNFDTSTGDITNSDRQILATLIAHRSNPKDLIARYTFTYADEHYVYIWGTIPNIGVQRAPQWFTGDKMSGEYTGPRIFNNSGIESAVVGDIYLHTADLSRGNLYKCVLGGESSVAQWVYAGNIFGSLLS